LLIRFRIIGIGIGIGIALSATACSLTTLDRTSCESHEPCREAFGVGSTCGADGYCEMAPAYPRCDVSYPEDFLDNASSYDRPFVYGNLMDRSLETHVARERSARLATKQANDEGGLEGRSLVLLMCDIQQDDGGDGLEREQAAVASAEYLVDTYGVAGIVGPASSGDTQAVFEAVRNRDDTVIISPSATSPVLFDIDETSPSDDSPGRLWRTAPSDALQGKVIAESITGAAAGGGGLPVAVIHEQGIYGEELANVFAQQHTANGGTWTLYPYAAGDDEELKEAARCGGAPAECGDTTTPAPERVLFISSQTADVITFLDDAATKSYFNDEDAVPPVNLPIILTDSAANDDVLQGVSNQTQNALFDQISGTRPALPADTSFVYKQFTESYGAEYDNEDVTAFSFTAHSFDAAWLLFYATAWTHFQEPAGQGIARGLRQVSEQGVVDADKVDLRPAEWGSTINAFRNGQTINVVGASGELDFDPATEETSAPIEVWQISSDHTQIETLDTYVFDDNGDVTKLPSP